MTSVIDGTAAEHTSGDGDAPYLSQAEENAEITVLAGLMGSARIRNELRGRLDPTMFGYARHQAIATAIADADDRYQLGNQGGYASVPAVQSALERRYGQLPDAASAMLWKIADMIAVAATVDLHGDVEIIHAAHTRRAMRSAGAALTAHASGAAGDSVDELRQAATTILEPLHQATTTGGDALHAPVTDDWDDLLASIADSGSAVELGMADLDSVLKPQPGHVVLIAGRAGIGKSAAGGTLAMGAATRQEDTEVTYLSYEMGRNECRQRLAAGVAKVRTQDMRDNELSEDDWRRLRDAQHRMPANLHIPHAPNRSLDTVIGLIHRAGASATANGHRAVVFVDYLQQVHPAGKFQNEQERVGRVSNAIQAAAQESGVLVVAMAQLNRDADHRVGHKPELADLRSSGELEQDASAVILLHRPDYYETDDPRMGEIDLILSKNRHGPQTTVTAAHQLHYGRIVDMAHG